MKYVWPSCDWATLLLQPVQTSILMNHLRLRYYHLNMIIRTDAPAKAELFSKKSFLQAEGYSATEFLWRMSKLLRNNVGNVLSNGGIRERWWKFNEGWTDVHDEDGHRRISVVAVSLIFHEIPVVRPNTRFTINELLEDFPQIFPDHICTQY